MINTTKIPISKYDCEERPTVLLWNDSWENPVVGKWETYNLPETTISEFIGIDDNGYGMRCDFGYLYTLHGQPTHFLYLEGIFDED